MNQKKSTANYGYCCCYDSLYALLLLLYDDSQKSTLFFLSLLARFSVLLHCKLAVLHIFIACGEQIVLKKEAKENGREIRSTCAARHCRSVCAVEK